MHIVQSSTGPASAASLRASAPVIDLDIDAIYQRNTARTKSWCLEYDCDGAPFVWRGTAKSLACADLLGRRELADDHAAFTRFGARLVHAVGVLL